MSDGSYSKQQLNRLPQQPGVYRFLNKDRRVIYVGKAKDLKKRVSSYFNKSSAPNRKTLRMVWEVQTIECTVVNSEFDALLLENNLIKQYQPRYNIRLKDDKSFPYVWIPDERFPRVIPIRNKHNYRGGRFFGPYASVVAMKSVLDLLRKLYTIRTCKYNLSEENIRKGKFKVCLEYHLGNCQGPCEGLQSENEYLQDIEQAVNVLKGKLGLVKTHFKHRMIQASESMNFELAQKMKERLELLEKFQARTTIVNPRISEVDVCAIISDENLLFMNYMKIRNGSIELSQSSELRNKLEEPLSEVLPRILFELRDRYESSASEVLINQSLPLEMETMQISVPQKGDKKKLVDLAIKNVLYHKKRYYENKQQKALKQNRILEILQKDLNLKSLPNRIECFDNSNFQGSYPVASMVHFKNGKPARKEYRHYNIRTVTGPDDFASMHEVTYRRYRRLLKENLPLPQLMVIDGGKGQLNAACEALRQLDLYGKIAVIGIAKRLEEIYFPNDQFPIYIDKKSPSLRLLQQLRDEAHRFAITFHRNQRSRLSLETELMEIPGIGPQTTQKLLKTFRSIHKIKKAGYEDLEALIGQAKAQKLREYFQLNP